MSKNKGGKVIGQIIKWYLIIAAIFAIVTFIRLGTQAPDYACEFFCFGGWNLTSLMVALIAGLIWPYALYVFVTLGVF